MLKVKTETDNAALPEQKHIYTCCRLCRGLALRDSGRVYLKHFKGGEKSQRGEMGNWEDFLIVYFK